MQTFQLCYRDDFGTEGYCYIDRRTRKIIGRVCRDEKGDRWNAHYKPPGRPLRDNDGLLIYPGEGSHKLGFSRASVSAWLRAQLDNLGWLRTQNNTACPLPLDCPPEVLADWLEDNDGRDGAFLAGKIRGRINRK